MAVTVLALLSQGCAERRPHAYPWATASVVRPRKPLAAPGYKPPTLTEETPPDLPWNFLPSTPNLMFVRQPARPRVAAPPAPESSAEAAKTSSTPLLAPQLSEQETAAARQQMNDSISVAQHNLTEAKKHKLNAAQNDLASKVDSFLDDARNAVTEGDWTRAKNLAKKAQVLSDELAQSL
jgi:hypothetical protein